MADVPSSPPNVPHGSPAAGIKQGVNGLKKLPPWAILVIVGGMAILVIYMRSRSSTANAAATTTQPSGTDPSQYTSGGTSPYSDPSMYGAFGSGSLPNGTGNGTNPTDTGAGAATGAVSDSHHDVTSTDSHDNNSTVQTSYSFGDINSPFEASGGGVSTGGGAPNRPAVHTVTKGTATKPKTVKRKVPKKKPKSGYIKA